MVTRIKGFYEYDDDDLTPGNKKEGGLHQNLYDSERNLKGNARFIPDDGPDPVAAEPVHPQRPAQKRKEVAERQLTRVQSEVAEFLVEVVKDAAKELVLEAKPHAKRLWEAKGRPALEAKRAEAAHDAKLLWEEKGLALIERRLSQQREKLATRKTRKGVVRQPIVIEGEIVTTDEQ